MKEIEGLDEMIRAMTLDPMEAVMKLVGSPGFEDLDPGAQDALVRAILAPTLH